MTTYTAGPDTFDSINYDPKGKPVKEVLGRCDDLFTAIKQKAEAGDRRADKLEEEIKKLREENENITQENQQYVATIHEMEENQLTEKTAIEYVYENTDKYEDWIKGSTVYEKLQGEIKELKVNHEETLDELRDYMELIGENEVKVFDKIIQPGGYLGDQL